MNLESCIKELILHEISENLSFISFDIEARRNLKSLKYAYSNGIVSNDDLDSSLEEGITRTAKWLYNRMRRQKITPDHLYPVEIFAYGIEKVFSETEKKRIRFDHGETPDSFVKDYGNPYIVRDYRKRLLDPPEFKVVGTDGHCACRA